MGAASCREFERPIPAGSRSHRLAPDFCQASHVLTGLAVHTHCQIDDRIPPCPVKIFRGYEFTLRKNTARSKKHRHLLFRVAHLPGELTGRT